MLAFPPTHPLTNSPLFPTQIGTQRNEGDTWWRGDMWQGVRGDVWWRGDTRQRAWQRGDMWQGGNTTGRRDRVKQRRQATWHWRPGEGNAWRWGDAMKVTGWGEGNVSQRQHETEGAGDQREGIGQHLKKKKKEKTHQASAASCHAFMSRKGAASWKKRDNPPCGLPARGGSSVSVERKDDQWEREKKRTCIAAGGQKWSEWVQCVTWKMWHYLGMFPRLTLWCIGNSLSCAPLVPPPPHPSSAHDTAPSLLHHTLRRDAPSSLPTSWDTMLPSFLIVCLFLLLFSSPFFSLLPLTFSLFSAGIWGPLLLANMRAGCPPDFTRPCCALLQHECKAHTGLFVFFFFFFSFADHHTPLSAPPSHVAPSLCVTPLPHCAFIMHRRPCCVVSRLRHVLCCVAPSPCVAPLSRLALPCRDTQFKLRWKWRRAWVGGWAGWNVSKCKHVRVL